MNPLKRITETVLTGLVITLVPTLVTAQEGEGPAPELPEDLFGQSDLQKELIEVFQEVERKLIEVDYQLADAGAGELPLAEVEGSGLEKLLRDAESSGREALAGIDRILEIAQEMGNQGQSGGSGNAPPQPGGESPLNEERDRGPMERENTPEAPKEGSDPSGQEGEQEEPGGEKPGEGEEPKDGQPDSPHENPLDGENEEGQPPQDQSGPQNPAGRDADAWGTLPPRVQEVFRNQGGDDLPVQYRDWIDTYYRRLNSRR